MAEEKGALCREEGVEGLRFWENWIVDDHSDEMIDDDIKCDPVIEVDPIQQNLEDVSHFPRHAPAFLPPHYGIESNPQRRFI